MLISRECFTPFIMSRLTFHLFCQAAASGLLPQMCECLAQGANVNEMDDNDKMRTPLHKAVTSVSKNNLCSDIRKVFCLMIQDLPWNWSRPPHHSE